MCFAARRRRWRLSGPARSRPRAATGHKAWTARPGAVRSEQHVCRYQMQRRPGRGTEATTEVGGWQEHVWGGSGVGCGRTVAGERHVRWQWRGERASVRPAPGLHGQCSIFGGRTKGRPRAGRLALPGGECPVLGPGNPLSTRSLQGGSAQPKRRVTGVGPRLQHG